jgi:AhpD family alkylhydroperoxidase
MSDESIAGRFSRERVKLNELLHKYAGKQMKRFLTVDHQVYEDGALSVKTKELLGLTASLVLRCDDCVLYHLIRCHEEGATSLELEEALAIGLVVGGSITIPHIRRALAAWDEMQDDDATG